MNLDKTKVERCVEILVGNVFGSFRLVNGIDYKADSKIGIAPVARGTETDWVVQHDDSYRCQVKLFS